MSACPKCGGPAWPGSNAAECLSCWSAPRSRPASASSEGITDKICAALRAGVLAQQRAAVLAEIVAWFPDCAQLLDSWHADGTAWTEWDESIRKRLAALWSKALAALPMDAGQQMGEGA